MTPGPVRAEMAEAAGPRERGAPPPPRFGADGVFTLLLSNIVLAATLGLSGLFALRRTWRCAARTPTRVHCDLLLVPGKRLEANGTLHADYRARLDRAAALYADGQCGRVLLLGGATRPQHPSEAEAGRRHLLARGVAAAAILCEERSRHTLENLQRARDLIRELGVTDPGLTSNRYHLARIDALAGGLGLFPRLCAAEERLPLGPAALLRIVGEAYYLHWYHVGRSWSRLTRNRKSLARIT